MNDKRYAVLESYAKFHRYKNKVYTYTFLAYGILHLARKSYTNMKIKLEQEALFDPTFLSVMDTVFMLCYAAGSFFSGQLGSQMSAPLIVSCGLLGSALCVFILAVFVWLNVENPQNNDFVRTLAPICLWMIHGLMQSTGGPANTAIMSNWFGSKNRGYVFGTWTCHQYLGNIMAGLLSSLILFCPSLPWTLTFVIPAMCNIWWAFIVWRYLPERPEHVVGLDAIIKRHLNEEPEDCYHIFSRHSSITLWDALRIPNVAGYSLAFGLFKFVNYAMFFWLPFYLSLLYSPSWSNLISVLYDAGMIPGGILVGIISDIYGGRRACVIATFTFTLIPFLYIFAEHNVLLTLPTTGILVVLGVMGCLIGGPINIITSAVAVDLAENNHISGRNDLMTVTGLINGSGSIIAALGLVIIGPLQVRYGWKHIWYLLMACTCLGTILLSPAIRKELRCFESSDRNDDNGRGEDMEETAAPASDSSDFQQSGKSSELLHLLSPRDNEVEPENIALSYNYQSTAPVLDFTSKIPNKWQPRGSEASSEKATESISQSSNQSSNQNSSDTSASSVPQESRDLVSASFSYSDSSSGNPSKKVQEKRS